MRALYLAVITCVMLSVAMPAVASAQVEARAEPSTGAKTLDMLVVRPFSGIGSAVSTALFLATLPITFPTGVSHDATYVLVIAPWRFTGARELGVYGEYIDGRSVTGRLIE